MRFIVLLTALCLACGPAKAKDLYVAKAGSDANPGTSAAPFLTIKHALAQSVHGDVVRVTAGLYAESWLEIPEGVSLESDDGVYAAQIYSGDKSAVRLVNDDSGITGFEIYGDWNQGSAGDGLVRILDSYNTWVRNCKIHDAPHDCDVIKIGADDVLIENCVIYNPAHRQDGVSFQECIDIFNSTNDPDGVTIRGCWVYHTPAKGGDFLIYAKGGAKNILWENNIFGPAGGTPTGNPSTGCGAPSPAVFPACENFIARNNIFAGGTGDGAFSFTSARNAHLYNNVFYNYLGGRGVIQFYTTQSAGADQNEDCSVYNNIFLQSNGKPVFSDRGRWSNGAYTYIPENFRHGNNIYHQVDVSSQENDVDISAESGHIQADPQLASPAVPDTTTNDPGTLIAGFLLQPGSPAIDAGRYLSGGIFHSVPRDIRGASRPVGGAFDIGVHEYGASAGNCATLGNGLDMIVPCLDLGDTQVGFTLNAFPYPGAFLDTAWELDGASVTTQ